MEVHCSQHSLLLLFKSLDQNVHSGNHKPILSIVVGME